MAVRGDASADAFIRTTNLPPITAFTMMGWFYIATAPGGATWANALTFGHASSDQFYGFQISGDAPCVIDLWAGGDAGSGSSLNLNTWYHLAMVVDGTGAGNARIYVNGVLDVSGAGNGSITAGSMYIGNDSFNEFWNGRWKAIKVWSAALSVAEIQAEMHTIVPRRLANLNGWSPCFPGATERAADYSGQGNHWTQNGTLVDEDDPPVSWGGSVLLVPFAAAGGGITGDSAGSLPALTLSAQGSVAVAGAAAPSLAALTLAASGAVVVAGSATLTTPALDLSASGASASEPRRRAPVLVIQPRSLAASRARRRGSVLLSAVYLSESETATGAASPSLAALSLQSTGAVLVAGASAASLPPLTLLAAAGPVVAGASSVSLPSLALSSSGTFGDIISGESAPALPALTLTATGVLPVAGSLAKTLPAFALSTAGMVGVAGAAAPSLPALTLSAGGGLPITGAAAVSLAMLVLVASDAPVGEVTSLSATFRIRPALTASCRIRTALTGTVRITPDES